MGNTKFSVGQKVYIIHEGKVRPNLVKSIKVDNGGEYYYFHNINGTDDTCVKSESVYSTVDELLTDIVDQVVKTKASIERNASNFDKAQTSVNAN